MRLFPVQKRKTADRRSGGAAPRFPFNDATGERVRQERRKLPERRLAGRIEVEWLEVDGAAG
jgi:hypothetical protein